MDKVKKISDAIKNCESFTVIYKKDEKLLKKNRSTKEKLNIEFPSLEKLTKTIEFKSIRANSFYEAISKTRLEEGMVVLEKEDSDYESPYEIVENQILKHKKSGEYYISVYSRESFSTYDIIAEEEIDLNYLLENYGTLSKSKSDLKEKQGLENPVVCTTLKLDNIVKIIVDEKEIIL